jgi:uncharacterized protein YfaS (alpha-2-macroglobulin family)
MQDAGCAMQAVDDPNSERDDVRVGVVCTTDQELIATAVLREKRLADAAISVQANQPSVVSLPVPAGAQGAVRVTLFDEEVQPMAERLIYRGLGEDMKIEVAADRPSYAPRDLVDLTVRATDLRGKPVEADLSLAVVDDKVLSFADDKSAHILARLYLESEMPGQEIEEPNFYFEGKPKSAAALDMVLGTQGWRRFQWQAVFAPPPPPRTATAWAEEEMPVDMAAVEAPMAEPAPPPEAVRPAPRRVARKPALKKAEVPVERPMGGEVARNEIRVDGLLEQDRAGALGAGLPVGRVMGARARGQAARDEDWGGADMRQANNRWAWAPVRQFPHPNYEGRYDGPRTDFRETIHWEPSVKTNEKGEAHVSFYTSDAITSFRVSAEGVSAGGLPGRGTAMVQNKLPVSLAVKMPLELSRGDEVQLPVTLSNETDRSYTAALDTEFGKAFKVSGGIPRSVKLKAGERKSFYARLEVVGDGKDASEGLMRVAMNTSNLKDEVEQTVRVVPQGFPQELSLSGTVERSETHELTLPSVLPGTIDATLTMYPSPVATMVKGTEGLIREPGGCFEQASSSNYPNIMVLSYLEENEAADPELVERTMGMLDHGYDLLTGYESPKKGYEWFGGDPGHEALTAYGLMEFADMSAVYGEVDKGMVERTRTWLRSRRDGKGGYKRNSRALDSFGRASEKVTNGYISYALSESGEKDMDAELAYQRKIAEETSDPYLLALAVNTLHNLEPKAATTTAAAKKLAGKQGSDGSFSGAAQSITMSGGQALEIETTALATMALLKFGEAYTSQVRESVSWLNEHRDGYGNFSSTQATVLALKALSAYTRASRVTQSSGVATVLVNGTSAGTIRFEKGQRDALVFDDIAAALHPGKNKIELRLDSQSPLPYSIAISYRSKMPASSPETAVRLTTKLEKTRVPVGEGVRMKVHLSNVTDKGQPMTLARVGLPGGLTFQTWQLEELVDKKVIDFYETREREVVLYFRSLAPKARKDVDLDLIARVPGEYEAPASSAYLYYTDELKDWSEPFEMSVTR